MMLTLRMTLTLQWWEGIAFQGLIRCCGQSTWIRICPSARGERLPVLSCGVSIYKMREVPLFPGKVGNVVTN